MLILFVFNLKKILNIEVEVGFLVDPCNILQLKIGSPALNILFH